MLFLADENFPKGIVDALSTEGNEVLTLAAHKGTKRLCALKRADCSSRSPSGDLRKYWAPGEDVR
jgi:hypothetical protein